MAMKEHLDNEFLKRRPELDLKSCMRVGSLPEYDASVIVPMWGYRDIEVIFCLSSDVIPSREHEPLRHMRTNRTRLSPMVTEALYKRDGSVGHRTREPIYSRASRRIPTYLPRIPLRTSRHAFLVRPHDSTLDPSFLSVAVTPATRRLMKHASPRVQNLVIATTGWFLYAHERAFPRLLYTLGPTFPCGPR